MKRSDWLKNKAPTKPDVFDGPTWSLVADEIVESLFSSPRFKKVCKGEKSSVRLMIGAAFFDASRHGVKDPPRPESIYNVLGLVTEFTDKKIEIKISTMDTALVYRFTWQRNKLTKKQVR